MSKHILTVRGSSLHLDERAFLLKGLRCSNALISDRATDSLIENLGLFAGYGVNAVSVYWMGSRFGDVRGYRRDASLDPLYAARMGQIIEAADTRAMVVLVGCLYWGNSRAKWPDWTQHEADRAVHNTVCWLREQDYRNVFVDVDNEGMARREMGFDNRAMVLAGKRADPACLIATNYYGDPPPEADLAIHHSNEVPGKPYVETEGSPRDVPGVDGYWGPYSKPGADTYNYHRVGVYTQEMIDSQLALTRAHLDRGRGYMLASTWLQAAPPLGPNHRPGGDGPPGDPGIRWWLDFLQAQYGPYRPGTDPVRALDYLYSAVLR
ncbi:MAG TPA: hypothetical protein VM366_14490 [Anaerolineae bacterium]|nr:hypothetical protein [Anaerolineae bacterium]